MYLSIKVKVMFKRFTLKALGVICVALLMGTVSPVKAGTLWESFGCENVNAKTTKSVVADGSSFDIVIYGGTPSAAAAALTGARQGKKVLVLSESNLFGGAISNGLGATDIGSIEANVGLSRTFLNQVREYYHTNEYRTEPKVAECIFDGWLKSKYITTGSNTVLDSASVSNNQIKSISFHKVHSSVQVRVSGKVFIDASYSGDLMFVSHTRNHLGMADFYSYKEAITKTRKMDVQFALNDEHKKAEAKILFSKLPQVTLANSLTDYKKLIKSGMPSFTYRLCITKDARNKIPFAKTARYQRYAPAWRIWMRDYPGFKSEKLPNVNANGTIFTQLWHISKLPSDKYDLNASYFTNLPMPKSYFEDLSARVSIDALYTDYFKSFLWFAQNDPSVPFAEKEALSGFGYCADEFRSTHGWPEEPYLREGRRLIGKSTMTTKDIFIDRLKGDAVAVGSYPLDSKSTVFVYADGAYARDRGVMFKVPLYEIPFSAMLPRRGPGNLIVSVNISSSPQAFSSIRMEPQFMQLGEAAGFAASLAVDRGNKITQALALPVKQVLAKANGFTNIKNICQRMPKWDRMRWGFNSSCVIKKFMLPRHH